MHVQKSFHFWVSYYDTASDLPDEERLAFYDAVMAFIFDGDDREERLKDDGRLCAYFAFKGIKANLKTSVNRANSAAKRWDDAEKDANGMQTECKSDANGMQRESKSKRERERKRESQEGVTSHAAESALCDEIVCELNNATGSAFSPSTKKTRSLIKARLGEGFTVDDFKRVIAGMSAKWMHDAKMRRYLRPETLFGTKFEGYLQECTCGPPGARASVTGSIDWGLYDG